MNENENLGEKRVLETSEKKGLQIRDLILVAVLLAAGAVLKFFVGSLINIGGMKPNFIIAMYCMAMSQRRRSSEFLQAQYASSFRELRT